MSRIPAIDPSHATGKTQELLAAVGKALGVTPNLFKVAAQSPAVLDGLVGLNGALARGALGPRIREAIALAVAQRNGCDYCLAAHTALGKGAGLGPDDIAAARTGDPSDPRTAALVRFARTVVDQRGRVDDDALAAVRRAGASDSDIVEVVALVALNVLTNYLNNVAQTEIDF